MTTAYTSLLGLALPVTGELSGTWGDTVNNSITSLLDTAVAGTTTLSTDGDVTLTTTTGASNQARQAILLCSGARTALRTITAPAQSKIYTIINATTGGFSVKIVGVGPTTGVTVVAGESVTVAWNGSDFIKVSSNAVYGAITVTNLTDTALTSGRVPYASTGGLLVDSANLLYSGTDLTVYGVTVGRGAGAVSTNTAVGASALAANTTGAFNTAIGNQAAAALTTGTRTVALGHGALAANTTGDRNHALGLGTLAANTTASYNTAVGYSALASSNSDGNVAVGYAAASGTTSGASIVAIGYAALQSNTTASNNIAIGYRAGYSNTTGNITVVGYQALFNNTTGTGNVAVGNAAMQSNTTASGSVAVGDSAMLNATGGGTAVGYRAMEQTTTGTANSAFGNIALLLNTTGSNNAAFGQSALYANTTGGANTAFGALALQSNTTASQNTAVGYQALYSNTTGSGLVAVGHQALIANTTANSNTGIGYGALTANTTGAFNAAIGGADTGGFTVLGANTTGSYNTAVGHGALKANTTASNNTVVGYQAGFSNTTSASNTYIGYQVGATATGNTNVGVGANVPGFYNAPLYSTTGNGNTALGAGAGGGITSGSTNIAIGNTAMAGGGVTGSTNIAIGWGAGIALTSGSSNTFVGSGRAGFQNGAGSAMTTGNANTILGSFSGNQGGLDIRTASNYIVLSDGDGNPRAVWGANNAGTNWLVAKGDGDITAYLAPADLAPSATRSARIGFINSSTQKNWFIANNWNVGGALAFHQTTASGGSTMDATPAAYFDGNGNLRTQSISVGLAAPGDGYGITFPASQSASSNANTLDDYEEGTWTPTDASGAGLSFTVTGAFYTKVGNLVTCWFELSYPATGSGASSAIGGLPFASKNVSTYRWSCGAGYNNKSITDLTLYGSYNSSQFNFYISNGNGAANSSLSSGLLACTFSYQSA